MNVSENVSGNVSKTTSTNLTTINIGSRELIIDREDHARISQQVWTTLETGSPKFLTRCGPPGERKRTTLERFIMQPSDDLLTFRIEGTEPNDFRKSCFVLVTMEKRQARLGKRKGPQSSIYKGVYLESKSGLWRACIRPQGQSFALGAFATEREAALAYNKASRLYFGDDAFQNDVGT